MGKRELVEVVEELKSSGTWMVPAGCKFVDVFIVGGGGSGASSGPERGGGGGGSVVWERTSHYEYGKFAELLKEFKKVNPNCKIVSISIQGYGSEMFYKGSNILNIAGWSESIFDVISSKFCGYKNMIEEIKKIKI